LTGVENSGNAGFVSFTGATGFVGGKTVLIGDRGIGFIGTGATACFIGGKTGLIGTPDMGFFGRDAGFAGVNNVGLFGNLEIGFIGRDAGFTGFSTGFLGTTTGLGLEIIGTSLHVLLS
jgi:hypothetical protein